MPKKIFIDWELVNAMLSDNYNEKEIAENLGICFNTLGKLTRRLNDVTNYIRFWIGKHL